MRARWESRAGAWPAVTFLVAAALAHPPPAPAAARHGAQVLYAEALELRHTATMALERKPGLGGDPDPMRHVTFDAYGRRFELTLESNQRVAAPAGARMKPGAGPAELRLYRGAIDGVAGSWARLASRGKDLHGMLWDGENLYVVEPAAEAANLLIDPQPAATARNLIFRLRDTLLDPGATSCAVSAHDQPQQGSALYASLLSELDTDRQIVQGGMPMNKAGATLRLEISVLGDILFRQRYADEQQALEEMLIRLNNVDGIFSTQLGVEIQASMIEALSANALSGTNSATRLLEELGRLRARSPALSARGLTHLFTGRDLEDTTVGMAYVNALCSARYGVALTEANGRNAWIESLIAAHEIGHNFGAVHDGEGACAATPSTYLMAPEVHADRTTFSQCSLDLMRPNVQRAQCIGALPPADIAIDADFGTTRHLVARPFEWTLAVRNQGGMTATNVRVDISVPPSMTIDEAWVPGGTCTSGAGVIACQLGDLPGSESRAVYLTLYSDVLGENAITARASADNDDSPWNNSGEGTLAVVAETVPPAGPAPAHTSSGGGGSMGLMMLLSLAGLGAAGGRRRCSRIRARSVRNP